jgi:hypothetical protein
MKRRIWVLLMRVGETSVALLVCGAMLGCLPSSFDDLTDPGGDGPRCDASDCLDAAMDASSDASSAHDAALPDAGDDASEPDAQMPVPTCDAPAPECDPAAPAETRTVDCPTCGSRMQSRSCSADTCTWGEWMNTTACTWCDECAEIVYCDTPDAVAPNRGTWCRQLACSPEQALAECEESIPGTCGTKIEPFLMQYL